MNTVMTLEKTEQEDSVLVRNFKNGDVEAFNAIVKKYGSRLYGVIFRMARDHKITDDILQETFIRLYYSINTYKEQFPFYPWLYRIAVNLTINHLRKNKREAKVSIDGEELQVDSDVKLSAMPTDLSSPEQALSNRELYDEVNRALLKLPPAMRAVFTLRIFDERTYNEIAQILNISLGTVMSRLSRSREKMKILLSGYLADTSGAGPERAKI
ncbi:MAG: sigma-70 family RNA polymerase sigma factor [Candidatus Eremiobacteraeota bacterium]|nr:sigma-70 family RNA polymerase sigma factor [Candidatus Eremiobacteraeota bacterium]